MKLKSLLAIVLVLMMALSVNAFASEEYDNIFDNPILEIVAPLKSEPGTPAEDAEVVGVDLFSKPTDDSEIYSISKKTVYTDGSYTEEYLFDLKGYTVDFATNRFPAYVEGSCEDKYVGYVLSEDDPEGAAYYEDVYLIDLSGEEVVETVVASILHDYNDELYTSTYTVYTAKEEDGKIIRTPIFDKALFSDELDALYNGTEYEDGLKFGKLRTDEFSLSCYSDINDKVYFADPVASYYWFFYKLGYLVEVGNNGYAIDYSQEDPESQRVYNSGITNVFTEESYSFYDTDIYDITDSGYAFVAVKDENRVETTYIAKIKKPAVIRVMVEGEKVLFDVLPTIKDGRTLVPLRAIFESLGAKVEWNGENQTITATKGETTVELKIGSKEMHVGEETKTLDVGPEIKDGRTLVPARAVAEAFGCTVDWDGEAQMVSINY